MGVFIDDLVIMGMKELYCMFISCVEYRFLFCEDNVDSCLIVMGWEIGFVDDVCWVKFNDKMEVVESEL